MSQNADEGSSRRRGRGPSLAELDPAKTPGHVAIVLDTKSREALDKDEAAAAQEIVHCAAELGVGLLTLCGSEELCAALEKEGLVQEAPKGMRVRLKATRGRDEILDAARRIAQDVRRGVLQARSVDARILDRYLEPRGIPELDLLICTGGVQRLSNFLIWQAAYAEMYIAEEPWTELGRDALVAALLSYQRRERRFGRVAAPSAASPLSLSKAG